jgi:predicted DCC family thiol-disulfide oxidoreductase YuxK
MGDQIILFDGVCNLCNTVVKFIIPRDPQGRFKFAALQSAAGQALLSGFGLPLTGFDSFVYIRGGQVYIKSAGALHVLKDMSGLWWVLYAFIIIPRPIRDWVYDRIAQSRYRIFGRSESCMVPTPDIKKRFLE